MEAKLKDLVSPIYLELGAVLQVSQQMEFAMSFALTLMKQSKEGILDDSEFDDSMNKFSKQTLGRLIGGVKKVIEFDEESEEALKLALDERNYIIHGFFHDEPERFTTPKGRKQLLSRVKEARKNIDPGYRILDSIVALLMEANGMSLEKVMQEVKQSVKY